MSGEFKTWEEVIVDFFETKIDNIQSGQKCELYKARKFVNDKNKVIKEEKSEEKLTQLIKSRDEKIKVLVSLRRSSPSTEISQWLDLNSIKSGRIIKTTHVLKFSHSSSSAEGILLTQKSNDQQLTTSSLKKGYTYDMAHNNGALISVSRFLALRLSGKLIIDCIINNEFEFLKPFSKDKDRFKKWRQGFSDLVEERDIKTTDKAKQLFFPLANKVLLDAKGEPDKNNYHLISPLFPSSLAEEIYSVHADITYGESQASIKKQRNSKNSGNIPSPKYHSKFHVELPNVAVQKFGGDYPRNVSMLNANRGGRCYLFSTQPPTWQSQLKPPADKKSLFHGGFNSAMIRDDIDYLRWYLLRFENFGLSVKSPERFKKIKESVENIIDVALLPYIANIQNLPAGWTNSENIALKPEHQYLLDPYRLNEDFQAARKASDWQTVVCDDFAWWLNNRLAGKDKKFTPQSEHRRMWAKLLKAPLREHNEIIDAELQFKSKVGL